MLPRIHRLKKKKDFDVVFKGKKGAEEDGLVFRFVPNKLEYGRFGFVIGKNVSSRATVRNLVRRRLSALVRKHALEEKYWIDGIFVAKPGLELKKNKELEEIMIRLVKKIGLPQGAA
ncbi:MAG: ribonuclease P protein component [Candidatus Wildermuthbacteria bacterium RIFCSPLOWO2_12_FULL_40_9]|uniref:Ribonuclease P protein component n=2 Tax=Candidatus Wildermuthiibacteriota TaxID=1817923 RepID=A0A1G2RBD5_9BACT|nr:MAG: ribonuclease P protein component [Candidatus Wildermuthbacteria bacterium RIFCSPHIGHO2_12_FULL_40_12]OHA76182.1 MAG: ribonuclease P protein component [Candidatus Wildermuthbacteria bacterium RIFCSPLOWO2_12_FULL_40_9]